jgi:hypothetical protein
MSTTTRTLWRLLDANWIDTDPDVSVISVVMQANGKEYVVVCSGPKGMRSDEFVPAITAAGAALNAASGGGVTAVRVGDPQGDLFDTGNQRAS